MRNIWNALAALMVAGLLGLGAAAPAGATDGDQDTGDAGSAVTVEHNSSVCGSAAITVTVPEETDKHGTTGGEWRYGVEVEVDGEIPAVDGSVLQVGPGSNTLNLSFNEDQGDGEVTVRYYLVDSTEWDIVPDDLNYQDDYPKVTAFREFTVDTDCLDTATPTDPTTTDQTCEQPGTITLADDDGVSWVIDGEAVEAGTSQAAPGEYTIAASADEGWMFDPEVYDADPVWNVEVAPSVEACPGPAGPQGEPGDDGEDVIVEIDEVDQTSSASELPKTGAPSVWTIAGVGVALVIIAMAMIGRRKISALIQR